MHVESKTIHWDAANAQMLTDENTVLFCLEVLYPFTGSNSEKSCCHFIFLFFSTDVNLDKKDWEVGSVF